jgi:hypothetical protein
MALYPGLLAVADNKFVPKKPCAVELVALSLKDVSEKEVKPNINAPLY